ERGAEVLRFRVAPHALDAIAGVQRFHQRGPEVLGVDVPLIRGRVGEPNRDAGVVHGVPNLSVKDVRRRPGVQWGTYVVSGFSRTATVRLKADTTYGWGYLVSSNATCASALTRAG